ncbi:hypothetical protein CesoFtcFv8_015501 [Champsocephalus esox]|uniref:Uncharacterized protein n=1 Tax=Champsocephalus esox TaxID=159716 RepID=A0AAN8BQX3_9TELE|nr:hypothetical protein CesoFtcFv8_015501 [Champsocephalus esox]
MRKDTTQNDFVSRIASRISHKTNPPHRRFTKGPLRVLYNRRNVHKQRTVEVFLFPGTPRRPLNAQRAVLSPPREDPRRKNISPRQLLAWIQGFGAACLSSHSLRLILPQEQMAADRA